MAFLRKTFCVMTESGRIELLFIEVVIHLLSEIRVEDKETSGKKSKDICNASLLSPEVD